MIQINVSLQTDIDPIFALVSCEPKSTCIYFLFYKFLYCIANRIIYRGCFREITHICRESSL